MKPTEKRHLRNGLLFIWPWLVGLGLFTAYPIGASLYYSFCDYSVLQPASWIGLGNYIDLFSDEVFWKALGNTCLYALLALPLGLAFAFSLALLLNTGVRGLAIYRTCFFLPSLVPMVALAVLWMWIFNGEYGVLNYALKPVLGRVERVLQGLGWMVSWAPPGWLNDPKWSKPALILISLWGTGHAMVIYLAGLQDVPQHLYEAAELDGAGTWHKIRHVTLPMVSPVILFNLIMGLIGVFQFFAVPYVMSPQGAPARSTYFFAMYLYDHAFPYLRMGYACALAWILFLIVFALTLLALRLAERHVHYEGG